jgi:hypothetical protein
LDTSLIHFDPAYHALGQTFAERIEYYRRYLSQKVPHQEWVAICHAIQTGTFTGLLPANNREHEELAMAPLAI